MSTVFEKGLCDIMHELGLEMWRVVQIDGCTDVSFASE